MIYCSCMKRLVELMREYVWFRSGLRNRLVFYFSIVSVLPLLLMGWVAVSILNTSHNYYVSQLETQILDQKAIEIEKFFSSTLGMLKLRVGYAESEEIELTQQKFLLREL